MNSDDIIAIIKWGPLILFLVIFLLGLLNGMVKGRRKTIRRLIYVAIFVLLAYFLTPTITKALMNLDIGGQSVYGYVDKFINENEEFRKICENIPGIKELLKTYPSAIISLLLFVLLVLVGLPLSFPIYFIYMGIYALISRFIFKYSRYKRDEKGKIVRNEKGKKIKLKRNKHRLTAGLIKGTEGVLLTSVILIPVGVITRLYEDANNASSNGLANIEYFENYKDYLKYVDAFNDSFIGKATNSKANKGIGGYLSTVEVDGNKSTVEKEFSNFVVAAVYIQESGIIDLLTKGDIDLKNLDLSVINIDKLEAAINLIFNSVTLNKIISDGVNYVLESSLEETLVKYTDDADIIDKIKYSDAQEVKGELLNVTGILKTIINSRILNIYQAKGDNYVGIINEVSTNDVETILNKILSIKILVKAMPGVVSKLLKDYGLKDTLTTEHNNEFIKLLMDVVHFVKSIEIESSKDITEGNILDNVTNTLYKDNVLKENSIDALATLLADIASSKVFDDVLVTQLNKLLSKQEINLNSQMIVNVNNKEDWKKELLVLDDIFALYSKYQKEEKVDFTIANSLLSDLKETKALILVFPVAYKMFFPKIGIEIDPEKIVYIDYENDNASEEEVRFYNYWKEQVTHFENITNDLAELNIASFSDLSLDLLEEQENVKTISKVVAEVFSTDLIKDGTAKLINDKMSELLVDYEVTLNEGAIDGVNNVVNEIPYYIVVDDQEIEISYKDNHYYIGAEQVTIVGNMVTYMENSYQVRDNTLARVWEGELINLSTIVNVVKEEDYTEKANLEKIVNAVDDMYLLKDTKTDLLMYAVKQTELLPQEEFDAIDRENVSFTKEKEILLNVMDKYDTLNDIENINFETINDQTIEDLAYVLDNALDSDIFGNYVANKVVDLARNVDVTLTSDQVKAADTWEEDLKLIRDATNMDADSFDKESIQKILDGIEDSSLLSPIKEDLLLTTARRIEIEGVSIDPDLTSTDIDYDVEKAAILAVADNLNLVEEISQEGFDLKTVDISKISNVLDTTIKSSLFGSSVVTNLTKVFTTNDIKHDLDANSATNEHLEEAIRGVESWNDEITTIQSLLNINSKDDVSDTLFTTIESSDLLSGCKATLLVKMVNSIDDDELVKVEVSELTDDNYALYNKEKKVLEEFAKAAEINDINDVSDDNKETMASILNAMKESRIFATKYQRILKGITDPIKNNQTIVDWGLHVEDSPNIVDWDDELDALLTIKDNVDTITGMTKDNIDTDIIGSTLDAIDNSSILSGTGDIANNLIDQLTSGAVRNVTKDSDKTWKETFEEAMRLVSSL